MTEKRFELVFEDYDTFSIRDNDYIQKNKHYHTLEEIVELLNQLNKNSKKLNGLHEKNQRLKSILQSERRELIEQNNNYRKLLNELTEENEQLKQKNNDLNDIVMIQKGIVDDWEIEEIEIAMKILCDLYFSVRKEKEQLEQRIKEYEE